MSFLRLRSLALSAGIILSCVSQLAVAGSAPKLVVRDKGYQVVFMVGPSNAALSLVGKTTLEVGTDKKDLPLDTYVFKPANATGGVSRLSIYFKNTWAGTITVTGTGQASLTGMASDTKDLKNIKIIKQSSSTSDIKLGN